MRLSRIHMLVLCLTVPCVAADLSTCAPLGDADRSKLAVYVQKKYNLPQAAKVDVKELSFVEESCYRKLQFSSEAGRRPFRMKLIASPDLRFLTRELLDSRIDPIEEARRQAAAIASKLAKADGATLGPKDAPVTMVLFSDFQCPFCSQMATGLMKDIVPAEGNKIRLIFRNFPLPMHPWARAAAEATACAQAQSDKYFWPLHDYIFTHQREFTVDNMTEMLSDQAAAMEGFDATRFHTCIDKKETAARVDQDVAFGNEMKVTGTPTLFINGQRVSGYRAEQIRTMIREQMP
ncbi:MAG: thioredoxin domain-containing protein [Bryobacteraceae bacterium]